MIDDIPMTVLTVEGKQVRGYLDMRDLEESLSLPGEVGKGFLLGRIRKSSKSGMEELKLNLDSCDVWNEIRKLVKEWKNPPPPKEVTKEDVLRWAEEYVKAHPLIQEKVWDEKTMAYRTVERSNSVEEMLIRILLVADARDCEGGGEDDLLGALLHVYEHGFKGYRNRTREELLQAIENEVLPRDNANPIDYDDLDDLLNTLGVE